MSILTRKEQNRPCLSSKHLLFHYPYLLLCSFFPSPFVQGSWKLHNLVTLGRNTSSWVCFKAPENRDKKASILSSFESEAKGKKQKRWFPQLASQVVQSQVARLREFLVQPQKLLPFLHLSLAHLRVRVYMNIIQS